MRILLAIILLLGVFTASAQKNKFKGAGFDYTKTAPNYIPVRGTESEIAIDSLTGKWMQYSYESAAWWHLGYFVTETGTSGAPSYTPNKVKSVMAINAGDSLYHYRAGSWRLIAGGGGGAGITDGDKGDVDVTGGGTVWTVDTGAVTMIKINQDGAAVGQVIKWNGTAWAPANDNTLSAGAGGLYGPSDLVTYHHTATVDSGLTFSSAEDTAYFNIIMAPGAFGSAAYFNSDSIRLRRYDVGGSNEVILNSDGLLLKTTTPDRVTIQGADARYSADYRATYSDRSLIDKKYGDDFYLQEVDSMRVSNDTLYISLARDSLPSSFIVLPDASDTNEIQALSIDSAATTGGQNFTVSLSDGGEVSFFVPEDTDLDTSGYNLDLYIQGDSLYIEDGSSLLAVDLSDYIGTDTSGYNLSFTRSADTIYITDGLSTKFVKLPTDTWGEQTVVTKARLSGNGTILDSLDIAQQGASVGQVLKWNGTSWAPDNDATGGAGAGENNVGANIGGGIGIYAGKTDTILQFKSLVEGYGIDLSSTSTEITIKADTAQLATLHDVAVVQADIDAHEVADGDLSPTNEIQTIDTFAIISNTLRLSLLNDALPFSSVSLSPYLDNTDGQNLGYTAATGALTISGGTGTTIPVMTASVRGLTPDGDGSGTDEFLREDATWGVPPGVTDLTIGGVGPTYTIESNTGTDVVISASGITLSESPANTLIFTATDPSLSNEGVLSVGAGTGTTSLIQSNSSGSATITLTGAGITTVNESGNTITVTSTEVGTVSNFSAGDLSPLFTTTESTTTTTPALAFALTNAGANTYFGNANGSTAAPSYTAAGALTKTDDTNVTLTLGGNPATSLLRSASLTLGWTGTLAVSRGGIGVGTLASNGVLYGNGTGAVQALAVNAGTKQFLSQASSGAPSWSSITASDIGSGAALTKVDDTNVTLTLGGAPTTSLLSATSLTLGWTGQLGVARGGTGASTLTGILQGNGTGAVTGITNSSTTGHVLQVVGASSYAWGVIDSTIIPNGAVSVRDIGQHGASSGQILKWNGTQWAPGADDTGGAGAGQNNVGENLGAGTGVYAGKTDTTLQFKSLVEGYGIDLSSTGTDITIAADTAQLATLHDVAVVQGDIDSHELADGDLDDTNELQTLLIDSVAITGKERFLLEISDGNTVAFDVDLNTDDQTLILDSAIVGSVERFELEVENGNSIFFDVPQVTDTDNQTLDTFEIVSNILRASLTDDGVPFKSVDLSPYLDNTDAQNLTIEGSGPTYDIAISGGTDITVQGAGIIALSETPANTLVITATEVDGSISNEGSLTVAAGTGTTSIINSNTSGQTGVTITAAGINTISEVGNVITLTATEVDGSVSNEGVLSVGAGTGTTSLIQSNSSGSATITLTGAGISTVNESGNTITITSTEVDGSTTNEIQRLDTFEIVSNTLRASLLNDALPFSSVDLSPYLDNTDTQDLSVDSTTIGNIERFTINLVGSPSVSFDVSNTTGTVTSVAATQPAAGITISGSPITGSGTLTFALANDLAGLEGQSGTGIVVRTGDGTYEQRTATVFSSVASTANLAIGNANGVSGNPLISIETDRATNKLFVQAVSTTNLDLNGTETIDGISVTNGQRVLVAGQTAQEYNGIWDVVSAGAWTRSTDANTAAKIDPGVLVNVKLGATYGGTMWRLTTAGPYTLGSTDLVFEEVFKDEDPTNELQTIDTLSLSGTVMSLSLEGDGLPASTLDFASIIGSAADVVTLADSAALKAYTGAATGVILKQAGRQGTFVRVPTTRAHDGFIVFTDGNGNKWQRIMDNVINVKWFGAKGDGVTDDTWAIQRAIDYSIYEDTLIKQVFIPTGNYVISKTIHLGYGNAYHSVSLIGDGAPTFRGEIGSFNGTMLSPTFSNSPAINIQGARYTTVENITLVGLNDIDGFLSDTSASNINNWLDSGLDAIADNQRTPYAGITIDGFSGTAPSPAYAHYAYPSYAGDTTQYNKDFSSQVKISNCGIHGFVAGIVLQPNSDGNGDFTQVEKCIIDRVAYGISVGNANSRNFKILDCYIDAHTGITNSTHGNQTGRVTLIQNNHFGGYQWFALNNLPYLEGLEINNNYGESFYWLGSIGSVAGNQPTIVFNGCDFSMLATAQGTLQRFGDFIGSGAYVFNDCSFKNNRLYQFNNTNGAWIDFNQCKFNADVFEGEPGDTVETYHDIFFRNMLFVVGTYPERIKVNKSRFTEYTETNSLAFPQQDGSGVSFPTTLTYTSYWLDRSNEGVDVQYKDLGYPGGYLGIASAFDTYTFSGRTFTGKVKTTYKHGIGTGDALFIRDGDVFLPCMITEIDAGDTITALLMADYKYNTTTGAFETAFGSTALSAANVQHISSRKFLNTRTITGTFTAGSTTVTDVKYVYDGTDAATNFTKYTPLLNMDGLLNAQTSPVSNDTWIDSVLTSSSILLSEAAIRNGTFAIQNCFTGNGGDKTAIPVQQIVYGNGNDIKSEAAFNYDSTNNRINLNTTSGERQITLNPKSGETTSSGGIRINSDGVADTDPVGRIEFVGNTTTGPYTQKGYIGFDISGSSAKGQALVFGLTTDGQSVLGTTTLYENQLIVNNSSAFTIANNTGRLELGGSTGIYSRDKTWLLGGSAYTTANSNVRLKLAGDNSDTSTTKYGLQIYNGFNQSYFSARNDGNVILGGRTVASEFQILEASGSGTNYTGFKAQPMSADIMYTLPAAAGTAGQQLTWNASNILTWADAGGTPVNIYTADGNIKDGGTIVDVSGNDPIILALDNATTEQNRMLRLTFDHTDDVTNTYGISFVGPNDSLEIRSYDSGMYLDYEGVTSSGEGLVISSNTILDLRGDSILISTPPTRTILHHLLGIYNPMAPQTVSQIEGTANGDILVWNETGGYWEIGTSAGADGNGIYDGSDEIPDGTIANLATDGVFTFDYSDNSDAIKFDDQTGYVRITDKSGSGQIQVFPGAIGIQTSTQITAVVGSNTLDISEDKFIFSADTGTVRLVLFEPSASGTNYTMFTQPAMAASQTYALPTDAPANGDVLSWNTGGTLSWEAGGGADGNGIYDGDGTLQAGVTSALLPNGATLQFEYDGATPGLVIDDITNTAYISGQNATYAVYAGNSDAGITHATGGWLTGSTYALTGSASVASTNTVTDRLVIQGNVASTVASAGFGSGILFQGESSTTDNQDMARITTAWITATHASKEGKIGFQLGDNGGALAEIANFNVQNDAQGALSIGSSTPVLIYNDGITTQTSFTLGGTSSTLTLGGSSGTIAISSSSTSSSAIVINPNSNNVAARIAIGTTTNDFNFSSGEKSDMIFLNDYVPTSGTGLFNSLVFANQINQTGGANGITRGIYLNPTLTAVADFRAIEISANTANAKAIYQTGAATTSNFVGGIAAGTTSAPNASAQIDIVSTTKGLGMPAMTDAQMNAIGSPREGLTVYSTDQDALMLRDNGIFKRLPTTRTVLKTADETVNNSSTYQTDDALTFTAKANKKYVVKYYISLNDPNNNVATGGVKLKVTASGATTVKYYAELSNLVFGATYSNNPHSDNAADIYCADAFASYTDDFMYVQITAYINPGASDRTVNLEWAQINANANNTKILEGSFLEYEEIN